MGLFTFFGNRNKPRPFNYQPIYWDPEKEEREKREKRIEEELGKKTVDGEFRTSIKRGSFRKYSDRLDTEKRRSQQRKEIRKLVIVAFLLIVVFLFFWTNGEQMISLYF